MTKIHVSPSLSLPLDWMTLATVVYGSRGSGKTTLGSVIAEEVTRARQRFCAIDLKGDWYGLKSTADGKGEGIPVVIFGGDHQDVPLEEGAGAFIGETIAALEQPAILDLEQFSKGKQVRFLAQFCETLYDRNREPLLLLLDEAQRYAPQKPIDPDAAKCLGAVEDLVKLGRKHGIGPVLFTQRGSGLNKEVSELCDMLVAFRTPGPLDQDRVKDWLDANTTKAQRDEVMGQLSGLPTGTAVFASGHPDLKVFGVYAVRRRETFDSSATPKVGQRRSEPKTLAKPQLDELRKKMAAAIERQKADDPKALRTRIRELEALVRAGDLQLRGRARTTEKRVEVPVLKNGALKHLNGAVTKLVKVTDDLREVGDAITQGARTIGGALEPIVAELRRVQSVRSGEAVGVGSSAASPVRAARGPAATRSSPMEAATTARQAGSGLSHSAVTASATARTTPGITARQQRFLDAIVTLDTLGVELTRETVCAWLGIHPRGGSVGEELSALTQADLIQYDRGRMAPTGEGVAAAGRIDPEEAIDRATAALSPRQRRIFAIVVEAYPEPTTKTAIAERMGIHERGGSFGEDLGRLRGRGLIEYDRGVVRAREFLFAGARR